MSRNAQAVVATTKPCPSADIFNKFLLLSDQWLLTRIEVLCYVTFVIYRSTVTRGYTAQACYLMSFLEEYESFIVTYLYTTEHCRFVNIHKQKEAEVSGIIPVIEWCV